MERELRFLVNFSDKDKEEKLVKNSEVIIEKYYSKRSEYIGMKKVLFKKEPLYFMMLKNEDDYSITQEEFESLLDIMECKSPVRIKRSLINRDEFSGVGVYDDYIDNPVEMVTIKFDSEEEYNNFSEEDWLELEDAVKWEDSNSKGSNTIK